MVGVPAGARRFREAFIVTTPVSRSILLVVGLFLHLSTSARAAAPAPTLERAHPRAPISAWSLPSGRALFESGARLQLEQWRYSGDVGCNCSIGVSALRLGLPAGVELQATFDGSAWRERYRTSYVGATDLAVAVKVQLLHDREGGLVSLLGGARFPTGGQDFRTPRTRPRFGILSSTPSGEHKLLQFNVLFEQRPEPILMGGVEEYIGSTDVPRSDAIVVERVVAAWEYAPPGVVGGYLQVHFQRDADLPDDGILGTAAGLRWSSGGHLLVEFATGYGGATGGETLSAREWFVAIGLGYAGALWGAKQP